MSGLFFQLFFQVDVELFTSISHCSLYDFVIASFDLLRLWSFYVLMNTFEEGSKTTNLLPNNLYRTSILLLLKLSVDGTV